MTTGEKIQKRRKELGLNTEQLGNMIGVTKSTVGRYESETIGKIPYLTFLKIAIALGTTPSELISEDDIKLLAGGKELDSVTVMLDAFDEKFRDMLRQATPSQMDRIRAYAQGVLESSKE